VPSGTCKIKGLENAKRHQGVERVCEIKPLQASPVGDIAESIFLVIKVAVVKRTGSSEAQEKRYSLLLTVKKVAFLSFRRREPSAAVLNVDAPQPRTAILFLAVK
jgi:hypothetical protein